MSHTFPLLVASLTIAGLSLAGYASTATQTRPSGTQQAVRAPEMRADLPVSLQLRARAEGSMQKGLKYLESVQTPEGAWQAMGKPDPAITAIVAQAFAQDPHYGPNHPIVRKALAFVMSYRQKDGGIYTPGLQLDNYYTSVALMFLSACPREPEIDKAIGQAQEWLKAMQWTEKRNGPNDKPITVDHPWYGGAGYGHSKRPDLSNTQMMLEALYQSGLPANDPTYQKAMKFISRCQMLSSTNDQPFAQGASDGGFIYSPANEGESKAGTVEAEGDTKLRSYGSMTYAGFKSMLYAKVDRNDERVKAAWDWIRSHYTLDENPNMPGAQSKQGLFYYYHVFAKALQAWGEDVIVDKVGNRHNWREDLLGKLVSLQRPDGSWMNEADRWYESNPHYITGLSVLSMQAAMQR